MDTYEATRIVFSRIQSLDSENASKIMGYILIQGHGDKEMIRLAFGPETLLQNIIFKAKTKLGLSSSSFSSSSSTSTSFSSTPSTPSTPSSPSPFTTNPIICRPSRHNFDISNTNPSISISSSNNSSNSSSNSSFNTNNNNSSSLSSPWSCGFSSFRNSSSSSLSYANILNGSCTTTTSTGAANTTIATSVVGVSNANNNNNTVSDLIDEYQLQDHLSFLNEPKNEELIFDPLSSHVHEGDNDINNSSNFHRRSYSVPGLYLGPEDPVSGFGWKPCLYFARGFCKNGTSCKFLHGDHQAGDGGGGGGGGGNCGGVVVSPSHQLSEFETCQEVLRSRFVEQQKKLVSQPHIINGGVSSNYNKCMNLLLQHHNDTHRSNAAAAALMMGEDLHKFSRYRPERMDLSAIGLGMGGLGSPSSRQIYLTFPADSTFREEDVSNYFSIYGPVQDVRIPYQQKRMFGFVTFVFPETVKLILAKGNPHFVCDSRVLVKPYKEKGKIAEKKLQQNLERAEYSACSSPSGTDPREPFDFQLGARMCYNNAQEILLRKKLEEQADLQQAIEMHGRRLMSLRLLDITSRNNHHQYRHSLSPSSPIFSPISGRASYEQAVNLPSSDIRQEIQEETKVNAGAMKSENNIGADCEKLPEDVNVVCDENFDNKEKEEESSKFAESDINESLEHALPENLFASPKKSTGDDVTPFTTPPAEASHAKTGFSPPSSSNSNPMLSPTATLNMASMKPCFLPLSSFSSGQGTIGL